EGPRPRLRGRARGARARAQRRAVPRRAAPLGRQRAQRLGRGPRGDAVNDGASQAGRVPIAVATEGSERHLVADDDGMLVLTREGTVLVVDPDGVTRRYVELSLRVARGVRVLTAASAAEALETLAAAPVDLVIASSRLGDAHGVELRRRMAHDPRLARVPFIVLSSDKRAGAKVAAFVAGVDDYLVKPCDGAELAARVLALIARSRRWRASVARPRGASLAGDFGTLPLPDLVAALELGGPPG